MRALSHNWGSRIRVTVKRSHSFRQPLLIGQSSQVASIIHVILQDRELSPKDLQPTRWNYRPGYWSNLFLKYCFAPNCTSPSYLFLNTFQSHVISYKKQDLWGVWRLHICPSASVCIHSYLSGYLLADVSIWIGNISTSDQMRSFPLPGFLQRIFHPSLKACQLHRLYALETRRLVVQVAIIYSVWKVISN